MKPMILIAAAPLLLAGCKFGETTDANTASTANASAPEVVPDSVTVNGVTYVRAGSDKIAPATPTPTPAAASTSTPPPISDTGSSVPANTPTDGDAGADHGQ